MFSWFGNNNKQSTEVENPKPETNVARLEGTYQQLHGHRGNPNWPAPRLVAQSDQANRADQGNNIKANEYLDEPEVLEAKINLMVQLIKQSKCCTAYTGAGLSRAAGIGDYATKAKNSLMAAVPKLKSPLDAQPTYAHRVLAAMERAGYLHEYVQQNHDGLPQKAGFPQEKINEIHGAWYDPSNPVVQFSGNLRSDLFQWMLDVEQRTDLCLCLGTSLSGMNADRIAKTPAKRSIGSKPRTLGTIIINLQQTGLDDKTSIRIWATLDDVFRALAQKLELDMTPISIRVPKTKTPHKFIVPYNANGEHDPSSRMYLNLSPGQSLIVPNPDASNYKQTGQVIGQNDNGHYSVRVGRYHYAFGSWWIDCLMNGRWPFHIPFMNENPEFAVEAEVPIEPLPLPEPVITNLTILQTHKRKGDNNHQWGLSLASPAEQIVSKVIWSLHPTFDPPKVECTAAPFSICRVGWGTFTVKAVIYLKDGRKFKTKHQLSFADDMCATVVDL